MEITDISLEDAGLYWVEINDVRETVISNQAMLTVEKGIPVVNIYGIFLMSTLILIISSLLLIIEKRTYRNLLK